MSREQREEMSLLIELNVGFLSERLDYAIIIHSIGTCMTVDSFLLILV